jgi:hypothetical protein
MPSRHRATLSSVGLFAATTAACSLGSFTGYSSGGVDANDAGIDSPSPVHIYLGSTFADDGAAITGFFDDVAVDFQP